ncbi:hypothetical protein FN846DRAFT_775652 [Sphaerosporella brunnea]|uniref:Uncharacterized protein n=1 Tax=Sphaerosporella brunnea TaxID=1250544 RepID=A0A5J5F378_9PEZI|nr:hypothetical protein FN846DRAFT_775652 [Sphaerosporella brunnea]
MPSRLNTPIIAVNMNRVAGVDPSNVDTLFSMWTIFSKCAESIENGRRLENISWRLWNRETFCCDNTNLAPPAPAPPTIPINQSTRNETYSASMPELSSSVESLSDDELPKIRSVGDSHTPRLITSDSSLYRGREKHMTPVNLARILEHMGASSAEEWKAERQRAQREASSLPTERVPAATAALPKNCTEKEGAEPMSARSTHSIVRGFSPSRISSSYRSQVNVTSSDVQKPANPADGPAPPSTKKKGKIFFLGPASSSDEEDNDSFQLHREPAGNSNGGKKTSFRDEVATRTVYHDDSDNYDAVSESAIEDEDWESSSDSAGSSCDEGALFQRVESRPELLTSRRSLLSTMLHEPERAAQLTNAASRSTPALRRHNLPRGLHMAPDAVIAREEPNFPGSKPIRRHNSAHPPTLSPRTTRRNMLATELTESLRKHLLWERQQKNPNMKRRYTALDVTMLNEYPQPRVQGQTSKTNSWNNLFEEVHEYHAAGW